MPILVNKHEGGLTRLSVLDRGRDQTVEPDGEFQCCSVSRLVSRPWPAPSWHL